MTAALLGTGLPPDDPEIGPQKIAPEYIIKQGPVTLDELTIELEVTLSAPTHA